MMCFIRINPTSAPLTPPGAAPTLTTIYETRSNNQFGLSEFKSQSSTDSSTKTTSTSEKASSKRKNRFKRPNPAPAREGIEGTEKEKKRTQQIADSLDLGLEVKEGRMKNEQKLIVAENTRGEPNRVVGMGDVRLERRRETVAVVMPVGKRRSVG